MTTPHHRFRRYGLAAASALLLGAACGPSQPPAPKAEPDTQAATGTTASQGQGLVTIQLCANRHDFKQINTVCRSATSTDPGALYQEIISQMWRYYCPGLDPAPDPTPHEWSLCMDSPPVLWPAATSMDGHADWNAQAQRIMAFYRMTTQKDVTMKSYELSLRKMQQIAQEMRNQNAPQLDSLRNQNASIMDTGLSDVLKKKGEEENKAAQAERATFRETLAQIQERTDAYKARVEAQQPAYNTLVEQFAAWRTNEAVVLARLQTLAQQASTATLVTLPDVQLELVQLSRTESRAPQQMLSDAARLIAQLTYEHETFQKAVEPYVGFMRTNNLRRPDLTNTNVRVLRDMEGYAETRYGRTTDIISRMLDGIRQRREALHAQALEDASRASLIQAATLKASQDFVAEVNARVAQVNTMPPASTDLGMLYLSAKLQEHESVLQLQPVCANTTSTPWMSTGCNLLALQFSKSQTYVNTTIRNTLRMNVDLMRMLGVSETLLLEVDQHLAANRLRAAAVAHDVAVRASDNLF